MTTDCTATVLPDLHMGCHNHRRRASHADYSRMLESHSAETSARAIIFVALLEAARTVTDLEENRPGSGCMADMGSAAFAPEWAAPCVSRTS
jgi:hypothetical protein